MFAGAPLVAPHSMRINFIKNFVNCCIPKQSSPSLARLFGYVVSKGWVSKNSVNITFVNITNADEYIIDDIKSIVRDLFGVNIIITTDKRQPSTKLIRIGYIKVAEFFKHFGLNHISKDKCIPPVVFGWTEDLICEFLRAYFEGNGGVNGVSVSACSKSRKLVSDLQTLLLSLGIVSFLHEEETSATNGHNIKRSYYQLRIYSENVHEFATKIGFISSRKRDRLFGLTTNHTINPNKDVIPYIQDEFVKLYQKIGVNPNGYLIVNGTTIGRFKCPCNIRMGFNRHKNVTYFNLKEYIDYFVSILSSLQQNNVKMEWHDELVRVLNSAKEVMSNYYFFSPVTLINKGKSDVFDICKEGDDHSFISNGIISHNTSAARILAAVENCEVSPGLHPCGKCNTCKEIFNGSHTDIIEIDGASGAGKVDQVREIKKDAHFQPTIANKKYFIIDEAHAMSGASNDALLKLLEEPPSHCRFILCTTDVQKMRPAILSRCQRHDFLKIYWSKIADRLEVIAKLENLTYEKAALNFCAKIVEWQYEVWSTAS